MGKLIEKIKRVWDYLVELLAFEIMPDDSEFDDSKIKSDFWETKFNDEDISYLNLYGPYGNLFYDRAYETSRSNDDTSYYSSFSNDY
jgi:hypothetical protein